jgi:Putative peptidoglycan binding domain
MKAMLYSVVIGSLGLALTTGAVQGATDKNKRQEKAKPQHRSATVQTARPATSGATGSARSSNSTAQSRQQRASTAPRTSSAVNRSARTTSARRAEAARRPSTVSATTHARRDVAAKTPAARPASTTAATARDRNSSVNRHGNVAVNRDGNVADDRTKNADVNRNRNPNEFRSRNDVAINRERNFNRTQNAEVNRFRNGNELRNRNNVSINRNRNVTVNQTQNAAFYRGGNVRVTNNWRGDAFRGHRYWAFRNYNRQWHDRTWWRSHYNRIIFVNSGWWYWNAGYWFPAWGYAPYVSYVYDGPIYAYNGLSPDQVTVNVQEQLAAAGYYVGPIDGILGPMTREAIANYQADNGLAITSAIDEPTLATMGLV